MLVVFFAFSVCLFSVFCAFSLFRFFAENALSCPSDFAPQTDLPSLPLLPAFMACVCVCEGARVRVCVCAGGRAGWGLLHTGLVTKEAGSEDSRAKARARWLGHLEKQRRTVAESCFRHCDLFLSFRVLFWFCLFVVLRTNKLRVLRVTY